MDSPVTHDLWSRLAAVARAPEAELLAALLVRAETPNELKAEEARQTARLIGRVPHGLIATTLAQFSLERADGQALMSLAEAYLRVPDRYTADELIAGKLGQLEGIEYHGMVARAANFARKLTAPGANRVLKKLAAPMIRQSVAQVMRLLGQHFVLGETIGEALDHAKRLAPAVCSFDMLGESARTAEMAEQYFRLYRDAIAAVGTGQAISVKLSALYPRYEVGHAGYCVPELIERLHALASLAAGRGVGLTVDAEEADRLEMSLEIISGVAKSPRLRGWDGLGMAVQAYQKRASAVIDWAAATAREAHRKLAVRLVKGAYWDTEIRRCQLDGLVDYPVFTRKSSTDVSYLACARQMLDAPDLQPAFATHNAMTVGTLLAWRGKRRDVEFQRLHGMGEELYRELCDSGEIRLRIYAPVGGHRELLPYLVRRLLENGANSSFVHTAMSEGELTDPRVLVTRHKGMPHPKIPRPGSLFGTERRNSAGLDLSDQRELGLIAKELSRATSKQWRAAPLIDGAWRTGVSQPVVDPADLAREVGQVVVAQPADVADAVAAAYDFRDEWNAWTVEKRADCLDRMSNLLERDRLPLMALLVHEAGRTQADALSEVREAVDFCRYYAMTARDALAARMLPGPTGESNEWRMVGRGVFACISPWNFPLAIFAGQIAAALVTGNCVVAKPAPQTPLIAAHVVTLLLEAGIPPGALQLLPGGLDTGRELVADPRVAGVVFTGSTRAAKQIARTLVEDDNRPLATLIAETGGLNAMIVDSTALPEQVVRDVIISAFQSAGQRCSALRLLCLQEDIAVPVIEMLKGAIAELRVGAPADIATDLGPVIDATALAGLNEYVASQEARVIVRYAGPLPTGAGHYIAPCVIELDQPEDLAREIFGPILHVVRWKTGELDRLVDRINARGYGLTLGVHSRISDHIERVCRRAKIGNIYVNRSMIGAVVGVQPFGGEGLSGTGPKAGGPNYLLRFCTERVVSVDLTSLGGNAGLLGLGEE